MPRKKLNIAIFHFAFIYSGGGERLVLEEAIRLSQLGHSVTCYAPIVNKKKCFPELFEKVKVKKILPKILPSWFVDKELVSILASCLFTPLFFLKFKKHDLYFGANQPGAWIAFLLSKINKKPYVIYLAQPTRLVHPRLIDQKVGLKLSDGFTMLRLFTYLSKPLIRYLDMISIRGAYTVFANGSYMSGLLQEVYGIQPVNCPAGSSGVQSSEFRIQNKKIIDNRFKGYILLNGKRIKKPFVLITNRHFPHKKFEYAIDAVSQLKQKVPIIITGDFTDYTKILKKQYAQNKNIYFAGLQNEDQLNNLYSQAALYIYPAPEEDFGMGIVEAMARGVPVVAWGNAGPTGIITHKKDGLLAKPFDILDFSKNMQLLLDNPLIYEQIVVNAYLKISEMFTYEKHISLLQHHMNKAIKYSRKKHNVPLKNRHKNLFRFDSDLKKYFFLKRSRKVFNWKIF